MKDARTNKTAAVAQLDNRTRGENGVRARLLARGLDVLFLLSSHPEGLKLVEIAGKTKLAQATALRILRTLGDRDVVSYNAKGKIYGLGPALIALSDRSRTANIVLQAAKAQLENLSYRSGETAALFQRLGRERFCIASEISNHDLGYRIEAGQRRPIYAGSGGAALMGFLDVTERDSLLANVPKDIRKSVLDQCDKLRSRGFSLGQDSVVEGVTGVASCIFDQGGNVVASLAVIGPTARFDRKRIEQYGRWVRDEAESISRRLGFQSPFPYSAERTNKTRVKERA